MPDRASSNRAYQPFAYAGLLPAAGALALALVAPEWRWTAIAIGYGYAALIFSFLGGVWWGWALAKGNSTGRVWSLAVSPSLIALASYLPWVFGRTWPGPSLILLGLCILGSPLGDRMLGIDEPGWLALRWRLSAGLGTISLLLAALTLTA